MYCMGFYLLPKGTHERMNTIRSDFFWEGAIDNFKYHMANWDSLCRPKDMGGLGILNTQTMNESLLVKWIWKIAKGVDGLWYILLNAKYMQEGATFSLQTAKVLYSSMEVYIRLNIFSNVGLITKLMMGGRPGFGKMFGWGILR